MDGFVDRLHALRFLRACDPSYRALTFTLVGLAPTGCISLLLDILFGSFLPSLWSSTTKVYSGLRSRHCYEIIWISNGENGCRERKRAVRATRSVANVRWNMARFGALSLRIADQRMFQVSILTVVTCTTSKVRSHLTNRRRSIRCASV